MTTSKFYVINLERRNDRKQIFQERWGDNNQVKFIEAIDGTKKINKNTKQLEYIDATKNDYEDNPRVKATIMSHLKAWEEIATGEAEYGVILEDDVIFREDFHTHWNKMEYKINNFSIYKAYDIIYLGCGDFLPVHTNPPTESLLKSQEKAHVLQPIKLGILGLPNLKSAYVFDWFGAFSYCLSKDSAQRLLLKAKKTPISRAVDVWLKTNVNPKKRYLTVPLLTYHSTYDLNVYDSDTWGIGLPKSNSLPVNNKMNIAFLIPTMGRPKELMDTIKSIVTKAEYPEMVSFALYICYDDCDTMKLLDNIRRYCKDNGCSICVTTGPVKDKMSLHAVYNNLWKCYFKACDFFGIWDDTTMMLTDKWDTELINSYNTLGKPTLACFQPRTDKTWEFKNPILTKNYLHILKGVSPISHYLGFIKHVVFLSKINVFLRNIVIEEIPINNKDRDNSIDEKVMKTLYDCGYIKDLINKSIVLIRKNVYYKPCGLWVKFPEDWNTNPVISVKTELYKFNNSKQIKTN
jgi:GR25 family glycosyltransferase involved in LPS biosynthesis